jgi:exopolyphosphatase / guanosine-5'-triphosphate,3'-diphosphate pyrophosphatase
VQVENMNQVKRLGIIDLGTNSVRFDVQKIGPGNEVRCLHREKQMVRLGEGVFVRGTLDPKATLRAVHAFTRFKAIASDLHVDRIIAFGTSTLREVRDSSQFLTTIKRTTGIDLKIISGEEEAKLIASAILTFEPHATGKYALVDIGGGSTEISTCRGDRIQHCVSFPLGAARLQQVFLKSIPPKKGQGALTPIEELRNYIQHVLLSEMVIQDWPHVKKIIGSSGTIRALSKIMKEKLGTKVIHRTELSKLVKQISVMSQAELLSVPGMEPKRTDIILSGAILLEECMNMLGAKVVYPTSFALRDGILLEEVSLLKEIKLQSEVDLFPLFARASKLGCSEVSLKKLVNNAQILFSRLASRHLLSPKWRDYLIIANIFRDTGWAVCPIDHEKHSYYILKNAELPLSQEWEVELVAQLALCLEGQSPNLSKACFKGLKKKELVKSFQILLALMQVGEALGPAHQEKILIDKVTVSRRQVRLKVNSTDFAELAKIRLDQRKALFEEVFGLELKVDSN